MKYWHKLDMPDAALIQDELKAWVVASGLSTSPFFWNTVTVEQVYGASPRLETALGAHGFTLKTAAIIVARSAASKIHVDDVPLLSARINLPVMNTKGTMTAFYEQTGPIVRSPNRLTAAHDQTTNKLMITSQNAYWDVTSSKMVGAIELKGPTVLRVSAPHAVLGAKPGAPRVTITLQVTPDPVYLLED